MFSDLALETAFFPVRDITLDDYWKKAGAGVSFSLA